MSVTLGKVLTKIMYMVEPTPQIESVVNPCIVRVSTFSMNFQNIHLSVTISSCFMFLTHSFLRTASSQPQTQTNGAFEPSPSAQQVNPERVGETQLFQHSHHHNGVATSHQLEPPPPLHNVQPSPATHTHHSSLYSEGSSVSEANSWELSPRSTTSNTPLIPRESNVSALLVLKNFEVLYFDFAVY